MTGVVTVAEGGERTWALRDFVEAIRRGERFVTREGGSRHELELVDCDRCEQRTIGRLTRPRKC